MTSGGRELLKWIAVALMTGDHAIKVFGLHYVPVLSELGRVAFPLFALVMAYNLAQPGMDLVKSVKRLFVWGVVATPVVFVAFGQLLPLNVLLTFSLATALVWCIRERRWAVAAVCGLLAPFLVDYQWAGVLLVVAGWLFFREGSAARHVVGWLWRDGDRLTVGFPWMIWLAMGVLCWFNGNAWALVALPLMQLGELPWAIPRTRWAFYGYYVGHLGVLSALALRPHFAL